MSLVDLIVQPGAAYLITDSGSWNPDGTLAQLVRKEIILPHIPVAISAVGKIGPIFELVAKIISRDDVPAFTLDVFMDAVMAAYDFVGVPYTQNSIWMAALFDRKEGKAKGYSFFTSPEESKNHEPWTWYPDRLRANPGVDLREVFGSPKNLTDPAVFDPRHDALPLIEAQRARRVNGTNPVAGQIWLTSVSTGGVSQTLLHEYPDRIAGD